MERETLKTLRDIATLICDIDASGNVEKVTQQLRGLHQRGYLQPSSAGGPRGAWLYDVREACRARVLLIALDIGIEGANLDNIQSALNVSDLRPRPPGIYPRTLFGACFDDTASGRPGWYLDASLVSQSGALSKGVEARLCCISDGAPDSGADDLISLRDRAMGKRVYATMSIPVSDLLWPLIEKFEG